MSSVHLDFHLMLHVRERDDLVLVEVIERVWLFLGAFLGSLDRLGDLACAAGRETPDVARLRVQP